MAVLEVIRIRDALGLSLMRNIAIRLKRYICAVLYSQSEQPDCQQGQYSWFRNLVCAWRLVWLAALKDCSCTSANHHRAREDAVGAENRTRYQGIQATEIAGEPCVPMGCVRDIALREARES